ncbi:ferredoxin-type protein NapG [Denitromonas iodatirespirans]|uniref:Ferredoxin-type protein NapG n=1 Tax=Denitromonas iodatirespirans TaxID=2795389 RepID=A0A944DDK1_DENI1|nr:ferredoxin-type protein NapG [Denitromonas iodatirespirans]MBT0963096.1 ferredoxin-type protein NapG [Denitromonas iodatirespirans]
MSTQKNTRPSADGKSGQARRRFLKEMAGAAGGACMLALGVGLYGTEASARPASAIRPPGALPEPEFLAACVRCGLCVRDCPFDTLKLSELGDNVATGTPYFEGRKVPCEMCEDIPCVKACPTGALDRELTDIGKARMGLAVLIDQETCLNFLGLRCDVCYRVCPVIDKAITLELVHNPRSDRHAMLLPTVHSDACTGCGKCEHSCVLPEAAIKVLPYALAQGKAAEHYRKGWVEKEAAGGSLIGEQQQLPMRGLEDRKYGDTRVAPGYVPPSAEPSRPAGIDSGWKP